jgi:hypothetical protein
MLGSTMVSTVCPTCFFFFRHFINGKIYYCIIDGVYRSGGATTQAAYEKAVVEVFDALDKVEKILTGKDYLVGDKLTEADVRLWVTIVCLNLNQSIWTSRSNSWCRSVRFGSILSMLVTTSAISAQSVTDILPSTSAFFISSLVES